MTVDTSAPLPFRYYVLGQKDNVNMNDIGDVSLKLALTLFAAWMLIFGCLMKGIKTSGKVRTYSCLHVYLSAFLPACFCACLPAWLSAWFSVWFSDCMSAFLPDFLPAACLMPVANLQRYSQPPVYVSLFNEQYDFMR